MFEAGRFRYMITKKLRDFLKESFRFVQKFPRRNFFPVTKAEKVLVSILFFEGSEMKKLFFLMICVGFPIANTFSQETKPTATPPADDYVVKIPTTLIQVDVSVSG